MLAASHQNWLFLTNLAFLWLTISSTRSQQETMCRLIRRGVFNKIFFFLLIDLIATSQSKKTHHSSSNWLKYDHHQWICSNVYILIRNVFAIASWIFLLFYEKKEKKMTASWWRKINENVTLNSSNCLLRASKVVMMVMRENKEKNLFQTLYDPNLVVNTHNITSFYTN